MKTATVIQIVAAFAAVALSSCAAPRCRVATVANECGYRSRVEGPKAAKTAFREAREWADGRSAAVVAVNTDGRRHATAFASIDCRRAIPLNP